VAKIANNNATFIGWWISPNVSSFFEIHSAEENYRSAQSELEINVFFLSAIDRSIFLGFKNKNYYEQNNNNSQDLENKSCFHEAFYYFKNSIFYY